MRPVRIAFVSLVLLSVAAAAHAQLPVFTSLESALACAAPPEIERAGADALRIVGAQTPDVRSIFTSHDVLVVSGGTKAGLQLGQQFLVRRALRFGSIYTERADVTASIAAIRIAAVNDTTALATADRICDAIMTGDYLVPFTPAEVPAFVDDAGAQAGELDFNNPARIVAGSLNRTIAAAGDFVVIDRGAEQGVTPGARFAVYRDLRVSSMPLAAIGEAVVMTTAPSTALVRITRTRDAVLYGDYLVPRK